MSYIKTALFVCILVWLKSSFSQNLIAYYNFNNNANDFSGNNNNGVINGGVNSTMDRFGNPCGALSFNGVNGYIEVPSSKSLKSPQNSLSVAFWFQLDSSAANDKIKWLTIICKGIYPDETNTNPQYRFQTLQANNQSTISLNTEFTEYDDNYNKHRFEIGKWNFYTMVYNGQTVKTYLNNKKIWEFRFNGVFTPNDMPLNIAKDTPGDLEYYKGALDDLRIYSNALSDIEISELYTETHDNSYFDEELLNCPSNIIGYTEKSKCSSHINYNTPSLTDDCGLVDIKLIQGLVSGSEFKLGSNSVGFKSENTIGFSQTCFFNIIIKDNYPPEIICPNDTVLEITNSVDSIIKFNYRLPLASDNCAIDKIELIDGIESGAYFPIGETNLKFKATDKSGNSSLCSYKVKVRRSLKNNKSEYIKCPSDIIVFNDKEKCGALVKYEVPVLVNGQGKTCSLVKGYNSGDFYSIGSTVNKYNVTNSKGELLDCSFNISVSDNEKPKLICSHDTVIFVNENEKSVQYNYSWPIATDNCKIDTVILKEGLTSGANFPLGITKNVFKAIDKSGNSEECIFNVTVNTIKTIIGDTLNSDANYNKILGDTVEYYEKFSLNSCELTLVIYDDSQQDNDTVSIFFNKTNIVDMEMIKLKKNGAIVRVINLIPGQNNYLITKAWNLGSISPNTLKIDIYDGDISMKKGQIKRKKPIQEKRLHSRPGQAAGIVLTCK